MKFVDEVIKLVAWSLIIIVAYKAGYEAGVESFHPHEAHVAACRDSLRDLQ